MKIGVLFYNLGGYHLARLAAAEKICRAHGHDFFGIELVGQTEEHPWGHFSRPDYVHTISEGMQVPNSRLTSRCTRQCFSDLQPDVLAIPGWGFSYSRAALGWCRRNRKAAVLMSESKSDDSTRHFWKEQIKKHFLLRGFSSAIVGGKKHRDYTISLGMNPNHIFQGYDVVDNDYFGQAVDQNRFEFPQSLSGRPYFLTASRFLERKNLCRLIKGFKRFIQRLDSVQQFDLVIIGSGTTAEQQKIENQIVECGLDKRVFLPGFVSYQEILPWYSHATALVHPALSEQWGLVVNEAMAAGLPVAVSKTCGCCDELIIENKTGVSFDPSKEECIAEALHKIVDADRTLMGQNALRHINRSFSPDAFGEGLLKACEVAAAKTKGNDLEKTMPLQ